VFFETGSKKGIIPGHAEKIARILDRLDASLSPRDMNLPAYKLHKLIGTEEGAWSVWVNGNWRITFRFNELTTVGNQKRKYNLYKIWTAPHGLET